MFKALNAIIENKISESNLDFYTVIIGTKPSKGARSPALWNKVYDHEEKKVRMVPLDVKEEKLEQVFNYLKEDKHCLGGAIAVPYKEKIFNLIRDNVKEEIKAIGAVNCFHRLAMGPLTGGFTGTNTDGEAALEPIMEKLREKKNLNIGVIGFGGAGKAILAFLLRDFKKKHKFCMFNRCPVNIKDGGGNGLFSYSLNDLDTFLPHCDLLINATSAGHIESVNITPVSAALLATARKTMVVYDIIYDPIKTLLLRNSEEIGLRTINGLRMNLIQAVLAYSYTNPTNLAKEKIYEIMS
tara:strand:- start:465 stop:1355 length:891 start_codon:yes stop_codon:yes gene_type:complete